jgi:membrane-associated phospholipid phosphatase
MGKRIANLTSNLFSPTWIGLVLIPLVSFQAADSLSDGIKWSLVLTFISILPLWLFVLYLVRRHGLDRAFANVRQQRTMIYGLAVILAGVSCIILLSLGAPLILLALFTAGFLATVIFMCINLWWKISLHAAFITGVVTLLFILYGFMSLAAIVLIPLVAWARIELGHHSLAQVVTGSLLATSILVVVFYLFGLL